VKDVKTAVGLDNAMMLEFANLCMKIMCIVGITMLLGIAPIHFFFGPIVGTVTDLLLGSFGDVQNVYWLNWIHAGSVCCVVFVTKECIFSAQNKYLRLRVEWLKNLPEKRARTIMVEKIPAAYRSDGKLQEFFEMNIQGSKVVMASCTKATSVLVEFWQKKQELQAEQRELEALLKSAGARGNQEEVTKKVRELGKKIQDIASQVKSERTQIKAAIAEDTVEGICLDNGFVQFEHRYHAELAVLVDFTPNKGEWLVSVPPEPNDILWNDLMQDRNLTVGRQLVGYALMAGLFFAYIPAIVCITNVARIIQLGPLQPIWQGLAPAMGLTVMVSFLPSLLLFILRNFLTTKSDSWAQARLQKWYFLFQTSFVVMAPALCQNFAAFNRETFTDPHNLIAKLSDDVPAIIVFYMNWLVLQWACHTHTALRLANFARFQAAAVLYNREEAKAMSEPEDQDYYGIGTRSARWATVMVVGIVFGTLSPPICLLTFINFALVRLVYGYLIPFAETTKADLGGVFWVHMLRSLFIGCIIYIIFMTGIIYRRSHSIGPCLLAALALAYVFWSLNRFDRIFEWERLTQVDVAKAHVASKGASSKLCGETFADYIQPELIED
jgi:hypothetical protein